MLALNINKLYIRAITENAVTRPTKRAQRVSYNKTNKTKHYIVHKMKTNITCNLGTFETVRKENESNSEMLIRVLRENFKDLWYNSFNDIFVITVDGGVAVKNIEISYPITKKTMNKEKNNICVRIQKDIHLEYKKYCVDKEKTMSEDIIEYIKNQVKK